MRRLPARLAVAVAAALGTGLAMRGVLRTVAGLYPRDLPPHPFLVADHAGLLYVAAPLAVVGVFATFLAPGLLLALAAGGSRRPGMLAVTSFGAAYLLRASVHAALKLVGLAPLGAGAFAAVEVTLDAALLAALALRIRAGRPVAIPAGPAGRRRLWWMAAIAVLVTVALLPALFWQDMTEDGLEALEIGRSLATHIVPRFPTSPSGLMGLGIGMITMSYPNGWLVALIGPVEAAARLPLALYLPLLFVVLADLIEFRSQRRLGAASEAAIVLALAAYVVTMVFSASYTPYSADAAAPASFETLTMLCIAATILCLWEGRTGWMLAFALLGYFARPTGLLVLCLLALGTAALPPGERRSQLWRLGAAVGACVAAAALYERMYVPAAAGGLAVGYTSGSVLDRLRYLTFTDLARLLYLAVPGGLLPAAALFAWRRHDPPARQLVLFTALYFLFFYPQAFIALHHFVPVMILPVVVLWRADLGGRQRWMPGAAAAGAALALAVSLPRTTALDRSLRDIGRATDVRVGDFEGDWAAHRAALGARRGVSALFRPDWEVADPALERVGAPLGVLYYSARGTGATGDSVNYVIQREDAAAPHGFTRVWSDTALAVYVRDQQRWQRDRGAPPRTDYRAAIYDIPRSTLYRFIGVPERAYQLDLAQLPGLWRLF